MAAHKAERRAARDAGSGRPGASRVSVRHVGRQGVQGSAISQGTADTSRGRLQSTAFPAAAATVLERGRARLYAFVEVFRGAVRSEPRGARSCRPVAERRYCSCWRRAWLYQSVLGPPGVGMVHCTSALGLPPLQCAPVGFAKLPFRVGAEPAPAGKAYFVNTEGERNRAKLRGRDVDFPPLEGCSDLCHKQPKQIFLFLTGKGCALWDIFE